MDNITPFNRQQVTTTRTKLPHWSQENATYFITFRLADSIPPEKIIELKDSARLFETRHPKPWDKETEEKYYREVSLKLEKWLDLGHGRCVLKEKDVRATIMAKLHDLESESVVLRSVVIMPNHAHLLVTLGEMKIGDYMNALKGATSRLINSYLKREGALWQRDYFDRIIRDERHYQRCLRYIEANPEKANVREEFYTLWPEGQGT